MKNLVGLGVVFAGLLLCLGCESKPPSTETETKVLNESPDYEKQMMGQMSGEAEKPLSGEAEKPLSGEAEKPSQ